MKFGRTQSVICLLLLQLPSVAVGQEASVTADKASEAIGYLRAWRSTAMAIESYEVVIRGTQSSIDPNGVVRELETRTLLRCDHESGRYVIATRARKQIDEEPSMRYTARGIVDGRGWECCPKEKVRRRANTAIHELVHLLQIPDLRLIGAVPYPPIPTPRENYHEYVEGYFATESAASMTWVGDSAVQVSLWREEELRKLGEIRVIDSERFVPMRFSQVATSLDGTQKANLMREEYTWEDREGLHVPVGVLGEKPQLAFVDGERVPYTVLYEYEFEWRKVNQDFEEDSFAIHRFDSLEDIEDTLGSQHSSIGDDG